MSLVTYPSLDLERELLANYRFVIGIDEVGRGALAGPVAVGAFALSSDGLDFMPSTLRDSKLVPEPKRKPLAVEVASWGTARVGFSSVQVIEQKGINSALRLAALDSLSGFELQDTIVLLDGSHNWLGDCGAEVVVRVKADRDCGSVAGAAISAKVARDELMTSLSKDFPDYGWDSNKGYAAPSHIEALQSMGPSQHHRLSWLTKILGDQTALF
jgi:ribonuclease HII